MSLERSDLKRLKISHEPSAWLHAESHTTGRSQQEIARDALHTIALQKIHAAKVLAALAASEAHAGPAEGRGGDARGRGK